ncbi:hypothetical protein RHSP_48159 [Rhizobium freirei PRF 81]|uniref:Uncharacterized protein n=1 Tax=Rhizobium freirei PRF 81 TaxID=363754 RepID=N6V1U4_9HYPH|nr:hypothetical protein RHSP_48159 [Rhizobium freirei PRF 81]
MVGVHTDAEAHAQHALFARRQRCQNAGRRFAQVRLDGGIDRQKRVLVLDEIAEMRILFVTDWRFERDRLLGDLQNLAHLLERHGELFGQFFRRRFAADFMQHLARRANDLVDRFDHVHRNTDRARLVGDRTGNRLTDPPGGVGRELVAAAVFELIDRLHQADIAFLNEVEELQTAVRVFLGDGDDEAQVGFDHFLLCDTSFALALLNHVNDTTEFRDGNAGFGREVLDLLADVADRGVFALGEFLPAAGCQIADRLHPVRIEFCALILLQEAVALDAIGFGKTQQAAFVLHEALVDVVELLDEGVDAVLVQRQRLDRLDQLILQLLVAALLRRRQRAGGRQALLDLLVLQLAQLLVGFGDGVERQHDLRAQFGFHSSQRQAGLVFVFFLFLDRQALATDIGNVVLGGAAAAATGLFLLLGSLAVGLDLLGALELRGRLGFRTGIGGFEIDDLAQQRGAFVEFVAPDNERLERQRALTEAADHGLAASLDALGNRDFAFARQKLDGTHFAQIHAHRIVRAVGRLFLLGGRKRGTRRRSQFAAFAVLIAAGIVIVVGSSTCLFDILVLDDVDAHVGEHGHRVFDLLRRHFFGGKNGVEFVHRHVAALLRGLDHLLDRVIGKIEKRAVGGAVAFDFSFFVLFDLCCHLYIVAFPDAANLHAVEHFNRAGAPCASPDSPTNTYGMIFNARLTTIAATGVQSWIASRFPAMVSGDPLDPVLPFFPKSNGDSQNFSSRQAFPAKKPVKYAKKPYPQAQRVTINCFPYLGSPHAMTRGY